MAALNEDLHSQSKREAAANRRADRIMAWAVGLAFALNVIGILTGRL